jgi:hypothetical protein
MESKLAIGSYPFPCVCLNCGAWYERTFHSVCPSCGQQPDPAAVGFYEWCLAIEKDFHPTNLGQFRKALIGHKALPYQFELQYGWSDTVLALISAIGLGILSNASYDVIKAWLLARKDEFLKTRFVADYDLLVELVVEYLRQHPYIVKEFDFNNEELRIKFNHSIKPLIRAVEQNAKIGDEPKR